MVTAQPTCSRDECLAPAAGLSHLCQEHCLEVINEMDDLPEFFPSGLTDEQLELWKLEAETNREMHKTMLRLKFGV